ncbi:MAG: prepilin-type N-terminal cleavage/methylation domain-containing protein [Thermoanaerobaculia bacterium]
MKNRGYTLVALMVGLTVMAILIAAVLPMASAEAQRDKEAELIFRGIQYAEGIRLFKRRYGRYPNTLKEMFEMRPRTLRKLWKDPMTNSDKWGLITAAGAPVTTTLPPPSKTPVPTPTVSPFATPSMAGGSGDQPPGPIMGVYSTSKKKGYRQFSGRENYNEWRFTEQTLLNQGSGVPCPPGPGGMPCRQ